MTQQIGLRPATPADSELCYQLHRAAMRGVVEAIWGWDEAEQRNYHRRGFDPASTRIITLDGHDAGVLIVHDRPGEIYLARIELHPDHQGRGIGTHLIRQLLAEAPVVLEVRTVNQRAHALYQRLGFREISRENGKIRMRAVSRRPAV